MGFLIEQGGGSPILGLNKIDLNIIQGTGTIKFMNFDTGATLKTYPANSMVAIANGPNFAITFIGEEEMLMQEVDVDKVKIAGVLLTTNLAAILNTINGLFANTGGGVAPVFTCPTSISLTLGNTANYELTATHAVSFSWDTLIPELVPVSGDHSRIFGGSTLALGVYTIVGRVINYHGTDTITVTVTVNPVFMNSYSFEGLPTMSYFSTAATGTTIAQNNTAPFHMPTNTSVGTPWTFWAWFKLSSSATQGQQDAKCIFAFGSMGGYGYGTMERAILITAHHKNSGAQGNPAWTDYLELQMDYGNSFYSRYIRLRKSLITNTWYSVMIVYDGGDTADGTSNAFSMGIDGVAVTPTSAVYGGGASEGVFCGHTYYNKNWHHIGYTPNFGGRRSNHLKISEMATFSSDQFANLNTFHNLGSGGFDFAPYSPSQWYRFGDAGDYANHPDMTNHGSLPNLDMEMTSGVVANYISDVP